MRHIADHLWVASSSIIRRQQSRIVVIPTAVLRVMSTKYSAIDFLNDF